MEKIHLSSKYGVQNINNKEFHDPIKYVGLILK
jgi:hypothetical protein